ncbi:MAG: cysteine synthase, partial [Bacteroidales bacterium]|nr:cysteine synthase [Bacteroidales bacterium]
FTGNSLRLKELNAQIICVALQSQDPRNIPEGWRDVTNITTPGFYQPQLANQTIGIDTNQALEFIKLVARQEGILLSPSAAANLFGRLLVVQNNKKKV